MKRWWSDLCTSITPVLGAKSGGEIMRNSPKYALWWSISRISTFSESRRDKLAEHNKTRNIVSEALDEEGRLSSETNCPDVGKAFGALGVVQACYSYTDESGEELFQVLRFRPKSFRQRHRGPDGRWVWRNDVRNVLYRLPLVNQAIAEGSTIWIHEGEDDVQELLKRGYIATTAPGGASEPGRKSKWLPEHTELLTGAKRVFIWADHDPAGISHATSIALSIREVVQSEPQVVVSDRANDAREHFALGGTINDLEVVYGSKTPIDRMGPDETEEELDLMVRRFLYAHPEFVPQKRLIEQRLRSVRDPCEWESELEDLVGNPS